MATSSIYKNVTIKDKVGCRKLIAALENAEKAKKMDDAPLTKKVVTLNGEQIREFFKKKK